MATILDGPQRILVEIPPRCGKSQLISRWTPFWLLANRTQARIGLATYEAKFAASWGRMVRDDVESNADQLGVKPDPDNWSSNDWSIMIPDPNKENTWIKGGGMQTAGIGGPFTGKGFDLLIIDDPIKNIAEALSLTYREAAWDWWTRVARTRLEPGASVIGAMQRWHQDDLFGRIEREATEQWQVVKMPMIAGTGDLLGRKIGEALWPERYPESDCRQIENTVGTDGWNSQYQQAPEQNPGECFFDTEVLNRLWLATPKQGPVIGKYFTGRRYAAGIDAAGEGQDRHSLTIKDCVTGLHVVQYASEEAEDVFALKAYNILKDFNFPLLGIESNGVGLAMTRMFKGLEYPPEKFIYQDEKREKVGIASSATLRMQWLVNYSVALRNGTSTPSTRDQIEEHQNFVKRLKGQPAARSGSHDDQVMSAVWAEYTADKVPLIANSEFAPIQDVRPGHSGNIDRIGMIHKRVAS